MVKLVLIRHAQSQNNLMKINLKEQMGGMKKIDSSKSLFQIYKALNFFKRLEDPNLTKIGYEQANELLKSELIMTLCSNENLQQRMIKPKLILVTSPMRRSILTLKPVYDCLKKNNIEFETICNGKIFEFGGPYSIKGVMNGLTKEQIQRTYSSIQFDNFSHFGNGGWYDYSDKKETVIEMRKRCQEIKEWIVKLVNQHSDSSRDKNSELQILFFTHGYFMSELIHNMIDQIGQPRLYQYNCGITTFDVCGEEQCAFKLLETNNVEHFENKKMLTSNYPI
jgi:broad specificity phosphatase PhoE